MVFGGVDVCMNLAGESLPDWFEPDSKDNWFDEGDAEPGFNKWSFMIASGRWLKTYKET